MPPIQRFRLVLALALLAGASAALGGEVTIPNTFSANTPALAAQVNANFAAVASAVNDNAADIAGHDAAIDGNAVLIAALQSALAAQQATIDSLSSSVATLTTQLAVVQGSSVMALASNLDMIFVPDPNLAGVEYLTAQFRGINVRIVNGTGATASANGLGNLSVGYNEPDATAALACSQGPWANQAACENVGGSWAANHRLGSHNLIVGSGNAYSQYGGLLAGNRNIVSSPFASVSGGKDNLASGISASVSGGSFNKSSSSFTSISGGSYNAAMVINASVSGGLGNTAAANNASVSGGANNSASGNYSSISGGNGRGVFGDWDWRAGTLFENL